MEQMLICSKNSFVPWATGNAAAVDTLCSQSIGSTQE
jgi:hypothetical protein